MRWTANLGGMRGSWNTCKVLIGTTQVNRPPGGNYGTRGHWIVAAVADSGEIPTTHAVTHNRKACPGHQTDCDLLKMDDPPLFLSTSVRSRVIKASTLIVHAQKSCSHTCGAVQALNYKPEGHGFDSQLCH